MGFAKGVLSVGSALAAADVAHGVLFVLDACACVRDAAEGVGAQGTRGPRVAGITGVALGVHAVTTVCSSSFWPQKGQEAEQEELAKLELWLELEAKVGHEFFRFESYRLCYFPKPKSEPLGRILRLARL